MFGIYVYMERFVLVTCPRVAYVLPKCRFISVSVNFEQTRYVVFLSKVMPNFYMTLMHACILFITLLLVIPSVGHEGEWMKGGAILAICGDGHVCK